MKKLLLIFAGILFTVFTSHAATHIAKGYGNSFIFIEQGIEFAVFPDGQFDFTIGRYGPTFGTRVNFDNLSVSFNSGYDYNAYVQYDDYGAVIQIENVPIYYDNYGRISQAGNVFISYNRFGYVSRVGGLWVYYNRYNRYTYSTGFINVYNRYYAYRPWHKAYRIPSSNYCVVNNRPYRRYYKIKRHHYYAPYTNNYREYARIDSRRSMLASNNRRSERYKQNKETHRRSYATDRRNFVSQNNGAKGNRANNGNNGTRGNREVRRSNSTRGSNNVNRDNTYRRNTSAINRTPLRDSGNSVKNRRATSAGKISVSTRSNTIKRGVKSNTMKMNSPRSSSKTRVTGNHGDRKTNTSRKAGQRRNK